MPTKLSKKSLRSLQASKDLDLAFAKVLTSADGAVQEIVALHLNNHASEHASDVEWQKLHDALPQHSPGQR